MAKVFRDNYGVPHIKAISYVDASKAIAYTHCEDDFFTIQLWFLAIKQKSGHFDDWDGPYLDFLSVFFNIESHVRNINSNISDEYCDLASSYCSGVNCYAYEHPEEILDPSIFPVKKEDLFQVQHLMEVIGVQIDKPYSYLRNKQSQNLPHKEGSNVIAIGSEKSKNGNALIAISPHQMLEGIFSYYEIHLFIESDNNEYHGFILPCTFSIFMGTNFNVAWGSTASYPEMYTIYKLEPYRKYGKIKSFILNDKSIKLKKHIYINYTKLFAKVHFPIIKAYYETEFGNIIKIKGIYYLIRIDMLGKQFGAEMIHKLSLCQSNAEVLNLTKESLYPYLDLVCIDKNDNLMFIHNSHEKTRKDKELHYQDVLDIFHLKEECSSNYYSNNLIIEQNPLCDYIVSANQSPLKVTNIERGCDGLSGLIYKNENSRSLRIKELLNSSNKLDIDDLKSILMDYKINLPIIRNVDLSVLDNSVLDINKSIHPLVEAIRNWDGVANPDSEGAAIFALFFYKYKEKYYVYSKNPDVIKVATRQEVVDCLKWVNKNYTLGQKLKDIQFLRRGNIVMPIGGVPDSINTVRPYYEKGKLFAEEASAFRMIIDMKNHISLTVHPYGSSSNEDHFNYTSQMKMFINGDYKILKSFEYYEKTFKSYKI